LLSTALKPKMVTFKERNQDFAKGGAWNWKILWCYFDDVFSVT